MTSVLHQAYQTQDLSMVPMDRVKFLSFTTGNQPRCLGTMNLNSCTAVAIVSRSGAILAHIAPRPSDGDPMQATGDMHVRRMMHKMMELLMAHRSHFSNSNQGIYSVVVYGMYMGEIALYDQVMKIGGRLQAWGFPPRYVPYQVLEPYEGRGAAKGTVLVDGRNQVPVVWVEDNLVA